MDGTETAKDLGPILGPMMAAMKAMGPGVIVWDASTPLPAGMKLPEVPPIGATIYKQNGHVLGRVSFASRDGMVLLGQEPVTKTYRKLIRVECVYAMVTSTDGKSMVSSERSFLWVACL